MKAKQDWEFPVHLEPAYLSSGKKIHGAQAVVREDSGESIATVGSDYHLVPHGRVIEAAQRFIRAFGQPEQRFHLANGGATLVGEFTYREKSLAINVNDMVGLRVLIINSYNAMRSLWFRVAGMVLKCKNGMTIPKELWQFRYRHLPSTNFEFPNPDQVVDMFASQQGIWRHLSEIELADEDLRSLRELAIEQEVIPKKVEQSPILGRTAWDLYNQFTNFVEHTSKASYLGKISRLDKVDRFFRSQPWFR